jgi:hypothetical protein
VSVSVSAEADVSKASRFIPSSNFLCREKRAQALAVDSGFFDDIVRSQWRDG